MDDLSRIAGKADRLLRSFEDNGGRNRRLKIKSIVFTILAITTYATGCFIFVERKLHQARTISYTNLQQKQEIVKHASTSGSNENPVLRAHRPSEDQLKAFVQAWLDQKALVLRGEVSANVALQNIAGTTLIRAVKQQRSADESAGMTQKIEASVDFIRVISHTPQRIELRADIDYSDQTLKTSGTVVNSTAPRSLKVSFILGRDEDCWRLQAYKPL